MQYEFLPRCVIVLRLDPATYPSKALPAIEVQGFFARYTDFVTGKLISRFEPGFQCLFDWYTFVKDELFFNPDNPYEYSPEFLHNG